MCSSDLSYPLSESSLLLQVFSIFTLIFSTLLSLSHLLFSSLVLSRLFYCCLLFSCPLLFSFLLSSFLFSTSFQYSEIFSTLLFSSLPKIVASERLKAYRKDVLARSGKVRTCSVFYSLLIFILFYVHFSLCFNFFIA